MPTPLAIPTDPAFTGSESRAAGGLSHCVEDGGGPMIWSEVVVRLPVFRLIIRSSASWSDEDQMTVSTRAQSVEDPPALLTERGFELSVHADTGEAARAKVEMAVHGIHSHNGVYVGFVPSTPLLV